MTERWLDNPEYSYIRRVIHETIKSQCPRCGAKAGVMCVDFRTGEETQSTCFERRNGTEKIGPSRIVTYALAIWPTDVISRATLRAFLPQGTVKQRGPQGRLTAFRQGQTQGTAKINRMSDAFQKVLKELEAADLIIRGTEFVRIIKRRDLLDRALYHSDEIVVHDKFLQLAAAAKVVEEQIQRENRPRVKELRQNEIEIIRQLMRPGHYSGRDGVRRRVRHEAGGISIPLGETASRWNPTKNRNR